MDAKELREKALYHATYTSPTARLVKVPAQDLLEVLDELARLRLIVYAHESLDRGE